jgi:demethylspheroidene O-methyltransferase
VPGLQLGLFDLPAVAARAAERQPGLASRLAIHPGSFLADPLPSGYDLHSLVRVLHDHDDEPAARLLAASRAALPPGGRLLIVEPMAKAGRAPEGHAYFGLYLAAMRSGRPREPREIKQMLRWAGFRRARELRTPLPLVARAIVADT